MQGQSAIAVIGPGALGGTIAAWLGQNKALEVTVCARSPLADLRVETPGGLITASPRVLTDPQQAESADWVLVATKAYDVASTAPWLRQLMGPQSRLVVIQNGVEHGDRFAPYVPVEQILPCVVDIPAARMGPGRMVQHRYGTMFVPEEPDGGGFVALFGHTPIAVATTPDIRTRAWTKLCHNSVGAVTALTQQAAGPAWSAGLEAIIRAVAEECVAVGSAEGAQLDPGLVDQVVDGQRNTKPGTSNSMQEDRRFGRPMEIEARNNVIVRLGRKHGIATPVSAMLVALLEASVSRS